MARCGTGDAQRNERIGTLKITVIRLQFILHVPYFMTHDLKGDDRHRHMVSFFPRSAELQYFLKLLEQLSAKNLISKVKSLVSPYFGGYALAFARASA